jgi:ribonucleoside-diphosphate reductase alpha chain
MKSPGIDPRFAQMFSRNKISGKYLEVNPNLVHDLQNLGLWEKTREIILESRGEIEDIDEIPQHIKDVYKTSFSTSPYAFIEVAARAQKWVDQAISRNMYLAVRDVHEVMNIYTAAWEKGLKTTYYLHMKPQHSAEQSTVRVNKSEGLGKKGFAGLFQAKPVEATISVENISDDVVITVSPERPKITVHGPVDPNDALLCEGCT